MICCGGSNFLLGLEVPQLFHKSSLLSSNLPADDKTHCLITLLHQIMKHWQLMHMSFVEDLFSAKFSCSKHCKYIMCTCNVLIFPSFFLWNFLQKIHRICSIKFVNANTALMFESQKTILNIYDTGCFTSNMYFSTEYCSFW